MPELPEVEIFRRNAEASVLRKEIQRVRIVEANLLKDVSQNRLAAALRAQSFVCAQRHGKYLGLNLSGGKWVVFHFSMTGELVCLSPSSDESRYTRLLIELAGGSGLCYVSRRKLGMIALATDFDSFIRSKNLGPDAFGIDGTTCQATLQAHRGALKQALTNQSIMAGIGNVYSDEILYQAHIRPMRSLKTLSDSELQSVCRSTKRILRVAIERRAEPERMPKSWMIPRRSKNQRCPRCGHRWNVCRIAGRSAYYCPICQH